MQPEKQANSIIDTLNHEISVNIPEYIIYVIEDFHLIDDQELAKAAISHLIETSPENCHFIITEPESSDFTSLDELRYAWANNAY